MPQFSPGASKTTNLTILVSPAGLNCTAEIFLTQDGTTKAVTSGPQPFVSTGTNQILQIPIVMPQVANTYLVRLIIMSGGTQIASYQAPESVVLAAPVTPPSSIEELLNSILASKDITELNSLHDQVGVLLISNTITAIDYDELYTNYVKKFYQLTGEISNLAILSFQTVPVASSIEDFLNSLLASNSFVELNSYYNQAGKLLENKTIETIDYDELYTNYAKRFYQLTGAIK